MASTYSNLKIQLMATGENSTTWGTVTNLNLGTAIEEAIVGSADVTFASGNVTLTLTDTNTSQTARNMRLRCTGTTGGSTRNLVVPSIEKPYIVQNDCADSVVVKTSAGTGVTVPAGKTMWVYSDGTNVVDAVTHLSSLTLGTALAIAQGGTGSNTAGGARTAIGAASSGANSDITSLTGLTTALSIAQGGTGSTSTTYCNLTANVTGTLPIANGGTGAVSLTSGYLLKGNGTSAVTSSVIYDNGTNVGIGTNAPGGKLDVAGTSGSVVVNGSGDQIAYTFNGFNYLTASGAAATLQIQATGASGKLTFATAGSEHMRITNAGNVGIGTATPGSKLDVAGTVTATGVNSTGLVEATTPNSGTTGGFVLRGNVTTGNAIFQVRDSTGATQWGYANITSSGTFAWSGDATFNGVAVGYRNVPRTTTGTNIAAVGDVGKCISISANIQIPNSVFAAGDVISIYNNSAGPLSITQGSGLSLILAASTSTGTRAIARNGMATIWFENSSTAIISGPGVS